MSNVTRNSQFQHMRMCVTGGAGFIGSKLCRVLVEAGHTVLVLDRMPLRQDIPGVECIQIDLAREPVPAAVLACDAIIHLAGANIFGRWTPAYKRLILSSRTQSAAALIGAVKAAGTGPKVFVSASATGYYGEGGEQVLTETSPGGKDFLAQVCMQWEGISHSAAAAGMRFVSVRTGIVLGPGGGMLSKLLPLFKFGLGGRLGSGKQWFSWIHVDDLLNIYLAAVVNAELSGPINAVAPTPVRNADFTKALGRAVGRPAIVWVPRFILKLILGELADVVLMSQKVSPEKLQAIGFAFRYSTIEEALQDIV